ncbi:MAG: TraB/GumN family protein [Gammaproteobacteria bacterium]|nr:TraB/GumN family protein [Gammaproteobacteria bacterium]
MPCLNKIYHTFTSVLVACLLLAAAGPVCADPVLWKIQSKQNAVYLFGSIHIADASVYPLRPAIENAYKDSDVLVVEADETQADQVKLNEILVTRGFYTGTETIADHIGKDTMQMLHKFLEKTGIPYATVARMRPGLIAITLTVARIVQLGYSPELGIDRYFINKARKDAKPIQQLETAEGQMDLMLSFSDDDLLLKHTVVSLDEMDDMFKELMAAWKSGDSSKIEAVMLTDQLKEHPEFEALYRRLFDDRNIAMTSKISDMLGQTKNYFVVVGAGHLVGKKGIVSLIKKRNYTIELLK